MGCESFRPVHDPRPPNRPRRRHQGGGGPITTITGPSGGPVIVPTVYRDPTGQPIKFADFDLDRETLLQALDHMGRYLNDHGTHVNLTTVGGAVNTIYLRSRQMTHDVDFFMGNPASPLHHVVLEAARDASRAAKRHGIDLGPNWFNNSTQIMMGLGVQRRLAQEALEQNIVVHRFQGARGGLTVYAAPWSYAFCGKLNRLCESDPRPYDINDAVVYLDQYLRTSERAVVSRDEVAQWCRDYGKNTTDAVLDRVNNLFFQTYRRPGIER